MHQVDIPDWVAERALIRLSDINVHRTALVVVDMQVIFVSPGERFATEHSLDIVANVNHLAAVVRASGGLVVWTRHSVTDAGPRALPDWVMSTPRLADLWNQFRVSDPGHRLDPRMDVYEKDIIIDKYRYSAFAENSSELKDILDRKTIDTLIIVGVVTNGCCESTARDANQLGYKTFFINDATATLHDEEHRSALISVGLVFADLRTTADMLNLIDNS